VACRDGLRHFARDDGVLARGHSDPIQMQANVRRASAPRCPFLTLSLVYSLQICSLQQSQHLTHTTRRVVFPREGPATAAIVWLLFLEDQTMAVLRGIFVREQDEGKGQAHGLWTVAQPMARAMGATRWVCNVWRRIGIREPGRGTLARAFETAWRQKVVARQNGSSALLAAPPGSSAFVIDFSSAFRQVPIAPAEQNGLVIGWGGQFWVDHCLPFGLRSATGTFGQLAEFVAEVGARRFGVKVLIWVDDLPVIRPTGLAWSEADFLRPFEACGFRFNAEKQSTFGTTFPFLGYVWDLAQCEVSFLPGKVEDTLALVDQFLSPT
jgi:hypothetical protein